MEMNKKIRVVHLQLLPIMSGVQKVALDEMALIDKDVFDPVLVCKMPGDFTKAVNELGVECHYVEALQRPLSPLRDMKALFKLYKLFKVMRPDVVHTHSSKTGVLGRIAAKLAGVPAVIHTVHGFPFDSASSSRQRLLYLALEWISARFCDAMVLLKNADLELTKSTLGVPSQKLHLIPNGVSVNSFQPLDHELKLAQKRQLLKCDVREVSVAMTGRLWEQKNPECFVRAAIHLLHRRDVNASFYLIGDGPLRGELQTLIDASGFSSRIKILGWRDDVKALLQVMDVFALPSRWEGLPLAILEAMAAGLPVVASNIPGNTDLVEDGVTGYLFEGENDFALAEKLLPLIWNGEKRAQFGAGARARAFDQYRIESRIETMQKLYCRLLANELPPPKSSLEGGDEFELASSQKQ